MQESLRGKPKRYDKLKEAFAQFKPELLYTLDELKKRYKQLLAKTLPDAGGIGFLFKQVENAFEMFDARVSKESDDFFSFVKEQAFNIEEE